MMTLVTDQPALNYEETHIENPSERRRGLRIAQARPIKIFDPTSARYIPGQTHDVSVTGLRIELPVSSPVREGKLVTVHVGLSSAGESLAHRRQMIPARVVWIDRSNDQTPSKMTAGLEFLASIAAHLDAA